MIVLFSWWTVCFNHHLVTSSVFFSINIWLKYISILSFMLPPLYIYAHIHTPHTYTYIWYRVLKWIHGLSGACYIDYTVLECIEIHLLPPLPPKGWNLRHVPPCLVTTINIFMLLHLSSVCSKWYVVIKKFLMIPGYQNTYLFTYLFFERRSMFSKFDPNVWVKGIFPF